jgi:hypothetical protein
MRKPESQGGVRPPTKRRKILLLLAGLVLALGAYLLLFRESEPTYQSQTLSHWVMALGETQVWGGDPAATQAIRQIGARAVPHLLKWTEYETPGWRKTVDAFCRGRPGLEWIQDADVQRRRRAAAAWSALELLGPEAKEAIPTLIRRLNGPGADGASRAATVLSYLGPDALPPLLAALTNHDPNLRSRSARAIANPGRNASPGLPVMIRFLEGTNASLAAACAYCLGGSRLEPHLVVPALTKALQSLDPWVRTQAAWALGEFGRDAASALPALRRLLEDREDAVRRMASNAVHKIAAQELTNAPPGPP